MTPDDMQAFLDTALPPWMRTLGIEVLRVKGAQVEVRLTVHAALTQSDGAVAAPALTALAETAMMLACGAKDGTLAVIRPRSFEFQSLRAGEGMHLHATAEVTRAKGGRFQVDCALNVQPSGKAVALAHADFPAAPK